MWIFDRRSGGLEHNGVLCGFGYSGHGAGVNNPELEQVHGVGPLPRGAWRIGPFFHHPDKGPLCAQLTPYTETFGRSGFLIHGDNSLLNRTASEGCIVLARPLREQIADSADSELEVR